MLLLIAYVSLMVSSLNTAGHAQGPAEACWQNELDPATHPKPRRYSSERSYEGDKQTWQDREPAQVGWIDLGVAGYIYWHERAVAEKLGNDKRAHCYFGCRIDQELDLRTSTYVAWFKESQDIADCNVDSHFEPADFDATVAGAEIAENAKSRSRKISCARECRKRY